MYGTMSSDVWTPPSLRSDKNKNSLKQLKDLEDGRQVDGDSGADLTPPDGFDMAKFHRGRQFFRDNLFSCCMGMFFALIIGLCFPDFLKTLVFTRRSDTPAKARKRYVATFKHISSWHYGNVWEAGSKAQKSVLAVRRMHKMVRETMEGEGQGDFLSQYNMALVQSAFIAFPLMYPLEMGIRCPQSDLDDYVYFWYGIGYLLGIESKYNICSKGKVQAQHFCEQIQNEIVLPNLENPSEDFYAMSNILLIGWRKFVFRTLSVPFVTKFFSKLATKKPQKFGLFDWLRNILWKVIFACLRNIPAFKKHMNYGIEREFHLTFSLNS